MAPIVTAFLLFLSILISCIGLCFSSQVYVVYMGNKNNRNPDEVSTLNHHLLSVLHGGSTEKARESHVYSYTNGFRGFAAKLTEEQASKMAEMPGVVSVFRNQKRVLHTTHSWDFMGLTDDDAMEIPGFPTKNQENVIIGFIDTGIWPESTSFSEEGMPPIPSTWKGQCQAGESFSNSTCNKKIIGARYYLSGYQAEQDGMGQQNFDSPRDSAGHGSHTASTASGRFVKNMNFNGLANGWAHGGAPMSRIAIYKTCWNSGCYDADLLAAFDDAIRDGVHILSISLGPQSPQGDYFNDAISIGSFHAASHGILVVASAGNEGAQGSATNLAPWMLTVGATSTDREFLSTIVLGSGTNYSGESLNTFGMKAPARIISASEANAGYFTPYQSSYCLDSSLDKTKARGKVLVCRHAGDSPESRLEKSLIVKDAGAVGMILIDETEGDLATTFAIPAVTVGRGIGNRILSYVNQTRGATSLILPAQTVLGSWSAPRVAAFSSKGPNSLTPEILKPDIVAPGLNILAAWSPAVKDVKFNIISGTSMSCPHITGLVALIKAVNPSWSASAIKSAIMTTATVLNKKGKFMTSDPEGRKANPFDYGSGFPDSSKFLNPGLIYDLQASDYISFLCSIGYDDKSLQKITGNASVCVKPTQSASDLNYPSITVPYLKNTYSVRRTVTNVGKPRSIYRASVSPPNGVNVTVVPKYLSFRKSGQKANFTVKFRVTSPSHGYVFGHLSWKAIGDVQVVTSPLVVRIATSETGLI